MAAISARKSAAVAGVLAVAGAAVGWVRSRLGVAPVPSDISDPPPPPPHTGVAPIMAISDPPPKHK